MRWRVAIPLPVPAMDFRPPHARRGPALGRRVLVPWQGGARVGVVVQELPDENPRDAGRGIELRETIAVLDDVPLLTPDAARTLLAVARETLTPDGLALADLVPLGLDPAYLHDVRLVPGVSLRGLPPGAAALEEWVPAGRHDPALLEFLRAQGLLDDRVELERATREVLRAADGNKDGLTPKQRQALETLRLLGRAESASALARAAGVSPAVVAALARRGLMRAEREDLPPPDASAPEPHEPPAAEDHGLPAGDARLHGGRPAERHARLASLLLSAHGAIVVAPDRATLERAWRSLGRVRPSGLLHGELNARQRERVWQAAASGETPVVFGTPMALLAPVPDLDLILIEEEGSDAHKLQAGTRSFAPDVARHRAREAGARLVLTGAVPAVETLVLPGIVLPPPRARLVTVDYGAQPEADEMGPMTHLPPGRESWPLSAELKRLLRQVASRGRQAVVIAPRRGYSAVVRCADCGWLPFCPNCDVPLRLHAERGRLECHQCGHTRPEPRSCPRCAGTELGARGPGSEWIAAELRKLLPDTPVYRFDRDRRDDLTALDRLEPGVVAGTTAVLGRPAPPDLALIALSFADTFAARSDFRAAERYHGLLRRLIEWHPARAPVLLVQTFQGRHPALLSVLGDHDAEHYPRQELAARERLGYPPFSRLAQVQVAARTAAAAATAALEIAALVRDRGATDRELLGPAPAPIARIKGLYAYHLLVRAPDHDRLAHLLDPARRARGARVRVDVNPREFSDLLE